YAAARREKLSALFPGDRLVLPAGGLKVRSNDTDYRFRPHSAFAHMTGLGTDEEPDAVLVLHPLEEDSGHEPVLYFRPLASRESEEFWADARYGEFWVGARPTLADLAERLGIRCEHLDSLADAVGKDAGEVTVRVVPGADESVTALVERLRAQHGVADPGENPGDAELAQALSELRLIKDDWEVERLREAVAASIAGFTDIVRSLPRAAR